MTVYKPLRSLARMAAGSAVTLARGEAVDSLVKVNNGLKEVPARLLEPIAVDKSNIDVTVISDGYQQKDAVYQPKRDERAAGLVRFAVPSRASRSRPPRWSGVYGCLLVHRLGARRHADADRRAAHLRALDHRLRAGLDPARHLDAAPCSLS